jgi:tRNA threonylcarbamoyl adenosine modification protein (Sua5/YciO/YrdC/YwlC family)
MNLVELDLWNPRPDRIASIVSALEKGGVVAFPTDTTWVVAATPFKSAAVQKLGEVRAKLRGTTAKSEQARPMSLLCGDLSTVGTFTRMDQPQFRMAKRLLPGPYTLLLPASIQVPKQLQSKRNVLGIRMSEHPIVEGIMSGLGAPLLVTTARRSDGELLGAVSEMDRQAADMIEVAVDTEPIFPQASTVLDLTGQGVRVVRTGAGPVDPEWTFADDERA